MQCLGSRRAWEHSQRGHILSEKLSTGSQHDQMKKHLCFSPLQFARDVLRQSFPVSRYRFSRHVAICAGCAEAKYKLTPEELEKEVAICAGCAEAKNAFRAAAEDSELVAICAGCAEAKSEFEREETIGVP